MFPFIDQLHHYLVWISPDPTRKEFESMQSLGNSYIFIDRYKKKESIFNYTIY